MPRYRFDLAYNGEAYFGWQRQPNQISVQEEIETAFTKLNSNSPVQVVGCGRTDTGVHAHHYVLHVDFDTRLNLSELIFKLNRMLPPDIAFKSGVLVNEIFHARFDATQRTYRYFIHQRKDAFRFKQSWYLNQELDLDKMNAAACHLIGKKDFSSFSKLHTDVKTNDCDVRKANWIRVDEESLYFEISADRFLRNMVRAIVGTLVDVGVGKMEVNDIERILLAKDRGYASTSAPGEGLFLWEVEY